MWHSPWSGCELQEGREPLVIKGQREKGGESIEHLCNVPCAISIQIWSFKQVFRGLVPVSC